MAMTDTGECIKMTAATDEYEGQVNIARIEWANAGGSAGDQCIITDANGEPVAHFVATTNEYSEQRVINRSYKGLDITTLDGGIIYVHLSGA